MDPELKSILSKDGWLWHTFRYNLEDDFLWVRCKPFSNVERRCNENRPEKLVFVEAPTRDVLLAKSLILW
ncbi:hypothetical protein [Leptospira stimsonii]|uniref:Uncharacterized protein n=1 Tax=Leptospira stimsonii TaxID=2202203 RepID=A0ABY2N1P0_9LEPT|nr:hypothetical protein [Leptospira stimsonii]TGK20545.1 hypothetical protein EHO98_08845 [Leptospira stimsonii]TGM14334.1 hypothetical protein EHQ90_12040 [Leptospira stimsonii]